MSDTGKGADELTAQERRRLVQQIHDSPTRLVLSVAGGSRALSDLQTAPGASRTLLEGLAPYTRGSIRALVSSLTHAPSEAAPSEAGSKAANNEAAEETATAEVPIPGVSEEGVSTLAQACLARAIAYATEYDEEFPVLGVACTAALATQRQRRGDDRAWMAIATDGAVIKTQLVEFPAADSGSGTGSDSADHAEAYYDRRMMQEHQLADALLKFIAAHVAA